MSIEHSIRAKVSQALAPSYLEVENESHGHNVPQGSETHFRLLVVSEAFNGKSRIDRQRMINDLLPEERAAGLHALTMRTFTSQEWDREIQAGRGQVQSPPCHGGSKR